MVPIPATIRQRNIRQKTNFRNSHLGVTKQRREMVFEVCFQLWDNDCQTLAKTLPDARRPARSPRSFHSEPGPS